MRRRHPRSRQADRPRIIPPLSSDIVAVLRRALRDREYAVAEHLLQALEELARRADRGPANSRCRQALDIGYLEVAEAMKGSTSAHSGQPPVSDEPDHG